MRKPWRFSSTLSGLTLGHIYNLKIPAPAVTFREFAQELPRGSGMTSAIGFKSAALNWQNLTRYQLTILSNLILATREAEVIYATLPRNSGGGNMTWIDISGKPSALTTQPYESDLNSYAVRSAALNINAITIINNPSNAL